MPESDDWRRWRLRAVIVAICAVIATAGALVTWRVTRPPTLPEASCGSATTHNLGGATQILGTSPSTLACFGLAARHCKSASIEVTEMGVDSGTNYVFLIGSGGTPCLVTQLSAGYGWTGGYLTTGPVVTTPCRVTTVTGGGVVLSCGGKDVLIPVRAAPPGVRPAGLPSAGCGVIQTASLGSGTKAVSVTEPGALGCFSRAARQCRPASIGVSEASPNGSSYVFEIKPGAALCHVTELRQDWGDNGAGPWSGRVTSVSCRLAGVTGRRGVMLRCHGQSVLIPAAESVLQE